MAVCQRHKGWVGRGGNTTVPPAFFARSARGRAQAPIIFGEKVLINALKFMQFVRRPPELVSHRALHIAAPAASGSGSRGQAFY
jgi:hypothetical protein